MRASSRSVSNWSGMSSRVGFINSPEPQGSPGTPEIVSLFFIVLRARHELVNANRPQRYGVAQRLAGVVGNRWSVAVATGVRRAGIAGVQPRSQLIVARRHIQVDMIRIADITLRRPFECR